MSSSSLLPEQANPTLLQTTHQDTGERMTHEIMSAYAKQSAKRVTGLAGERSTPRTKLAQLAHQMASLSQCRPMMLQLRLHAQKHVEWSTANACHHPDPPATTITASHHNATRCEAAASTSTLAPPARHLLTAMS